MFRPGALWSFQMGKEDTVIVYMEKQVSITRGPRSTARNVNSLKVQKIGDTR